MGAHRSRLAQKRSTNREAARLLELAVTTLDTLPDSPETLRQAIDLRFETKNALTPLAEFDRIVERLLEARRLLDRANDERHQCKFPVHMRQSPGLSGRTDEAIRYDENARSLAERLGDDQLLTEGRVFRGTVQRLGADFAGAKASCLDVLDLVSAGLRDRQYLLAGFPDITSGALLTKIFWHAWPVRSGSALRHRGGSARDNLGLAKATYRDMGMVHWTKQVERLWSRKQHRKPGPALADETASS